jgi:energy-coupling factor transporter ATP-binding protein EcfA2
MNATISAPISARWIQNFDRCLLHRKSAIVYGNIHDRFLWRNGYQDMHRFLEVYGQDMGYEVVMRYDPIDGLAFAEPAMRDRYESLVRDRLAARFGNQAAPAPNLPPSPAPNLNPMAAPPRANPAAAMPRPNLRVTPEDAFGDLRAVVSQAAVSVLVVVDLGDMLTSDPDRYGADERNALVLLKKCTLEADVIRSGTLAGYRNAIVILGSDLKRIPIWFHHNNPSVGIVQVTHPNKDERCQFALRFGKQGFYGGSELHSDRLNPQTPSELEITAEEFADLTDGFQTMDLEAIRHTSWQHSIPFHVKQLTKLIDLYKFGKQEDPFEQISPEKVARASEQLSKSVIGQPRAIQAVTEMLTSAKVGISMSSIHGRSRKPKGIFFFAGATGVGKTELAKAMAQLLFGDEQAFARFDMSEYKEEHAAEKLAGAPPGFVGYEEGGQLTNRVMERPYSILLFDEIEKAHPKVLDKFLQILEDGRLTDGKGQTAYFNQTVIIFTSNIGASDLTDPQTGQLVRHGIMSAVQQFGTSNFTYEQVETHFKQEVAWHFTSRIGRAELLNRLGNNVLAFDLLRPEFVAGIGAKFLDLLSESARDKYGVTLTYESSILDVLQRRMIEGDNLLFGGRQIKNMLETLVEKPLCDRIFKVYPDLHQLTGKTLSIGLSDDGDLTMRE